MEKSWVVAFPAKENARRFHEAMVKLQAAQHPEDKLLRKVLTRGERVYVFEAADEPAIKNQLDRLEGMPEMVIHAAGHKNATTFGQMMDRLFQADIICIGETHDSDLCHRVQLQII